MSPKNQDLHGNAPDKSEAALLLIDVINDLEFPEGDHSCARPADGRPDRDAEAAGESRRASRSIYVNDNFGRWRSDFNAQVEHCLHDGVRGQPVVELLRPDEDDYFVLKPKHSGFFSTTLDTLLDYLRVETLILTGHRREHLRPVHRQRRLHARLPPGRARATAWPRTPRRRTATPSDQMRKVLKADIRPSTELSKRCSNRNTRPDPRPIPSFRLRDRLHV